MKDHRKLRAFELADELALEVYKATRAFPREEAFGLTSQLRRAAVSAASNIVEGCARSSRRDFLRFLEIAHGSLREVGYQLSLAHRLGYLDNDTFDSLNDLYGNAAPTLAALINSLRRP